MLLVGVNPVLPDPSAARPGVMLPPEPSTELKEPVPIEKVTTDANAIGDTPGQ